MTDFPTLKTGAVMQYPATSSLRLNNEVIRFLDGREQRYRTCAAPLRTWTVRLDLLDDFESAALEEFFDRQQGSYGTFRFTDPWDGTTYNDCSIQESEIAVYWHEEMRGQTSLTIRQNRT